MNTKRTNEVPEVFYSVEGLRRVVELLEETFLTTTQEAIAEKAGVSPGTLSRIKQNKFGIVAPPQPKTLMALAPYIIDPETGLGFDPWKFVAIACGFPDGCFPNTTSTKMPISAISNLILGEIARTESSVASFAASCGLSQKQLRQILETNCEIDEKTALKITKGLNATAPGWTLAMLEAIDPMRVKPQQINKLKPF